MEKRLFIAVLISVAFLYIWGKVIPRLFPDLVPAPRPRTAVSRPTPTKPVMSTPAPAASDVSLARPIQASATLGSVPATREQRRIITVVDEPEFVARFSNRGAQLVSFQLKKYKDHRGAPLELVKPRPSERLDFPFGIQASDKVVHQEVNGSLYSLTEKHDGAARELHYHLVTAGGTVVAKTFRFSSDYLFDFSVAMSGRVVPYRIVIGPGIGAVDIKEKDSRFLTTGNAIYQSEGSFKVIAREKAPGLKVVEDPIEFVGIEDNYFLTVLRPQGPAVALFRSIKVPTGEKQETRKEVYAGLNASGGKVSGKAFFGPKQAEVLEKYGLEKTLKFGMFGLISRFLLSALIWLYSLTRNYGWAIIVLTIIIKILLYPLQHKSIVSMKKMQKVQPKMNVIRDRYKKAKTDADQRQKMNMEMMKLYQQEGINPMSGCWPILLQLPILWGFYSLLSNAIELRGADFMLWINDLAQKDPYYITPILMTATMFIQQAMTPTTVDPVQKRMFMMMPLIFGFIFKDFPSGLVLYWLVQNILTIVQQMIMNKYWKEHPAELK